MALAQTFFNNIGEGCFVTSLDLYFETKDDNLPITIALIETLANTPGRRILPFSTVTKIPSEITVSADGTTATKFTFESPVYLKGGYQYAVAMESNSTKYKVFVSELGENVIGTNRRVSEQPLV